MIESNYSQTPAPLENPSKKKYIFLLVGILLLILIVGLSIFLIYRKNTSSKVTPILENGAAVTTTPVADTSTSTPYVEKFPDDLDRDGVSDIKEKELGLSNREFDTDNDGLADGDELNVWKTDPKKADTDGDGFNDGYEVFKGYDPNGSGKVTSTP